MDWKKEAEKKLRDHEAKKNALESISMQICQLEEALTSIRSATADGTAVPGGGNAREDMMISNVVKRQELAYALKQAKYSVLLVEKALKKLSDQEKLILDRFYINHHKGSVDRLCEELGVEKATVYRRKDDALRHFTLALYGVMES